MAVDKRLIVTIGLVAVMAVAAGVAISPYLLSIGPPPSQIVNTQNNIVSSSNPVTSNNVLYSSSTSSLNQAITTSVKWLNTNSKVVSWSQASSYVGQTVTVEGTIVYTHISGGGHVFLDFHYLYQGYFYVVIFSSDVSNFRFSPASFYLNKEVRVIGYIQTYKGSPEIIVHTPSQIELAYMGFNYP